jgi:hypothetical protein
MEKICKFMKNLNNNKIAKKLKSQILKKKGYA